MRIGRAAGGGASDVDKVVSFELGELPLRHRRRRRDVERDVGGDARVAVVGLGGEIVAYAINLAVHIAIPISRIVSKPVGIMDRAVDAKTREGRPRKDGPLRCS
jgi:hypothetical protein